MEKEDSQGRFVLLAFALTALFTVHAFLERIPVDVVMTVVLLTGLWSVSRTRWTFIIGSLLSLPAIVVKWTAHLFPDSVLAVVGLSFALSFVGFITVVILLAVLRAKAVTLDIIVGGICVYLLLAMIWALAYSLLEFVHPGAFAIADGMPPLDMDLHRAVSPEMLYFSVTTLTTAGFGDIRPVTHMGQTLASLELLVGQLYLAIFIARLVSLYQPRSRSH